MDQEYQHWLFTLSAPTTALNLDYGAAYFAPNLFPESSPMDLKDSWDIESRQDLINTVIRMIEQGHADELSYPYYLWHQIPPDGWKSFVSAQEEPKQVLLGFVAETAGICGFGGIQAWDLSRMGYLCRIGLLNGWLTERESLWFQSRIANRARHYYDSWQQYTNGFLTGRTFWLSLSEERTEFKRYAFTNKGNLDANVSLVHRLFASPDSPYLTVQWDRELAEMDKPESLGEVDWS
ncbi:DUF1266 domain-containing protein [Budvicia diplopodorum]|uniref:DUF1266 domain-containing protein n=1 Tax=Budvicia diplopodorum TaxID=1119056 RepID=UPI001358495B|nr:DUF1266 domain-containing protein [Budvicia diplopodorum]